MHSKSVRIALIAAVTLLMTAPAASAQFESMMGSGQKPLRFWLGGGVSVPVSGDFKGAFDTGFNGRGMVTFQPAGMPVGVRLDLSFQKFELSGVEVSGGGIPVGADASTQILSGLGNVVYALPLGAFRPYVSAGVGAFRIKQDLDDPELTNEEPEVEFGINGAVGFQFRLSKSMSIFAEGRLDNVYTDKGVIDEENIKVVPVTFGIVF
ncbi:MAG: outer membrane beta-barrel protein [Candidatus Eisenbacteria bacterium]|nr:outer membrane beta-barrel protein [Candidatus Eisenbacteria bacterium]